MTRSRAMLALACLATTLAGWPPAAAADTPAAIRQLLATGPDAAGADAARKAVDDLTAEGTKALPAILAAVPDDVVKANWLRAAFTRIVADAVRDKKPLPADDLLAFARDPKNRGRARRLALEAVESVKPGTTADVIAGGLTDPEFNPDAVAARVDRAAAIEKADPAAATKLYLEAFDAARDVTQCLALAQRLKALGVTVDAVAQLGVIREWLVVGPFADPDESGYATPFPPEKGFDPKASYDGTGGKVGWKRFTSDAPDGRVDLLKAVGPHDGAVAYAAVVLTSPKDQSVELRGGGDDNLAVWVNGTKAIDHPTYRSHLRTDWHRAAVQLKAGENTLLVKVCQCPAPKEKAPGPPAKWEFHLRVVTPDGRGLPLPVATPKPE